MSNPKTRSAAHRIGLVPCPGCNEAGLPATQVVCTCAWCWDQLLGVHTRFVAVDKAIEWAREHGVEDEYEVPTSPQSRSAITPIPDTEPEQ